MKNNYFQPSKDRLDKPVRKILSSEQAYLINQYQIKKTSNIKDETQISEVKNLNPTESQDLQQTDGETPQRQRPSYTPSTSKQNQNSNQPLIERISINFRQQVQMTQVEIKRGNLNDLPTHIIISVQCLYRIRLAQKQYKQLVKKQNYRKSVVNELLTTEKQYLVDLKFMGNVQRELKQRLTSSDKIIGASEIKSLFLNLDAIQGLSEEMLEKMTVIQQCFNALTKIGNYLQEYAIFFKLYFDYFNNYNSALKTYSNLKKDNAKFKDFITQLERNNLKGAPFDNYLIKPIQRVPKYVLLLKDLQKNTNSIHPDYVNISNALEQFIKVNNDNNRNMDKLQSNQRIFELQKQFGNGTPQLMIVDAKREFKSEESLKLYIDNEPRSVIIYFLTDLILVTEREDIQQKINYKLIKNIYIDQNSYAQELEDLAYISYLFRLIGKNETVTLIADNMEDKTKFINYINGLIEELKKTQASKQQVFDKLQVKVDQQQIKNPVLVKVIGTQEVYETNVKTTFTQYIIQIEIANIVQKIFMRFSNFLAIQKDIQILFPQLKLPYIKEQNWLGNHEVKIIEGRKIQMMNFLQTLLTTEEMEREEGQVILKQFQLPANFYSLPQLYFESNNLQQSQRFDKRTFTSGRTSSAYSGSTYRESIQQIRLQGSPLKPVVALPPQDFLQELNQKILDKALINENKQAPQIQQVQQVQEQFNIKEINGPFSQRSSSQQNIKISASRLVRGSLPMNESLINAQSQTQQQQVKIKVQILTFPNTSEIEVFIGPDTRGTDIFEDVILQVELQTAFDFKLYIQEKYLQRPIEEDELLWNLLVEKQTVPQSAVQRITSIVKRVSSYIYNYNQKPMILKKHLFLPEEIEKGNYEDPKRVELMAQQTLMEINQNQLKLNDTEYIMSTALKFYLDGVKNVTQNNIPFYLIQQFLPVNVFKAIPKDNWLYNLPDTLKGFEEEVSNILLDYVPLNTDQDSFQEAEVVVYNDADNQIFQQPANSFNLQNQERDRLQIGYLVFLKLISQTQFYGLKIYEVTPDKDTLINLQKLCQDQFRQYLSTLNKSAQNQPIPSVKGIKLLFCVGYDCVTIYSNYKQNRPLLRLNYSDITQVKAHPLSLLIQLKPQMAGTSFQIQKSIQLHFDTGQSFVIQMLIQEYQEVRETLEEYNDNQQ